MGGYAVGCVLEDSQLDLNRVYDNASVLRVTDVTRSASIQLRFTHSKSWSVCSPLVLRNCAVRSFKYTDISRRPLFTFVVTIMSPTYFKFTTTEGINRRLTFSELPTWSLLASKLHVLYGISLENVGVSYVDSDNDEITVSSDEELQDFYKMTHQAGQVIKFAVVDLHASQNTAGKPLEFPSLNRNPFDGDPFEFVGEWERFPSIIVPGEDSSKSGPHAFVEVLSSNNSVVHDHAHQVDTDVDDDHSTMQPPLLNKGKGRSLSFGAASITSVLGEEMSHKHPIHVYDLNSRKDDKENGNSFDDPSAYIHVAAQSTPKVQAKIIEDNKDTEETPTASKAVEVDDPPLPSLDESPAPATSASLIQDLASLVHDASQVVSSHPELSEGLRNIGRNISTGTYWAAHHEALSDAVNGLSNPPLTEERRQADEEAAIRRLTDIVGNFFRSLSQATAGSTEDARAANVDENPSDQSRDESFTHTSPPWEFGMRFHGPLGRMAGRGSRHHGHHGHHRHGSFPHEPHAPGSRPNIPPPHAPHSMPHNGHSGPFRPPSFPSHPVPPPPPPPPPHAPAGTPFYPSTQDHPSPAPPPPEKIGPSVDNRRQSYQGVPSFPISNDQSRTQPPRMSAQDLRAQVEAAKRIYKAEKERYRQERDQRRRERLTRKPTGAPVAETENPRVHETSSIQFQGTYPELERVGVPRRSNTHLGHGPFRHFDNTKMEDLRTRAIARITKKLADVSYDFGTSTMF